MDIYIVLILTLALALREQPLVNVQIINNHGNRSNINS